MSNKSVDPSAETNSRPSGLAETLRNIALGKKLEPDTPSERIVTLARHRDYIYDRIKEWDNMLPPELPADEAEVMGCVYNAMKTYREALGNAIKFLVDHT